MLSIDHFWMRALLFIPISIAFAVVFLLTWFLGLQLFRVYLAPIPPNLPWSGLGKARFLPKLRATLRELSVKRTIIEEGYEKVVLYPNYSCQAHKYQYSKHDKPFILPSLFWPVVVLPPSQTRWITSQPENVLSTISIQDGLLGVPYFVHGPDSAACHDFSIITRDLTRNIGRFTPVLLGEIAKSCQREFDSDDWREVEPARAMEKIASEAVSRAIVGELAWYDEYHKRLHAWEYGFGYCGLIFGHLCPRRLKPFAARLLMLPLMYLKRKVGQLVLPEIEKRLHRMRRQGAQGMRADLLQCVIDSAETDPDSRAKEPGNILGRTILYNMFAQHTTQKTVATVLFDLLSYPSGQDVQQQLVEEAKASMSKIPDDPYATRDMLKLDSAIRESMRLNPMSARGIPKEVVKPGGLTTPDGLFLPEGCHISTASVSCMMKDSEWYERGDEFAPLRFYDEANTTNEKQKGASQVSEQFLAFSIGK